MSSSNPAVLQFPSEETSRPIVQPRRTVAQIVEWFLSNDTRMFNLEARRERARVLGLFCARYGEQFVDEMIGADLLAFVQAAPRVKAANTVDRWYRTVKHPFSYAEQLGLIDRSPFRGVKSPKGNEGRDLTPLEFRRLLRLATPAFRRVLIFLRFTGARPGEMSNVEWPHVQIDSRVIVLREHKTMRKTGRPRRIYFSPVVVKLLIWLKRRSASNFVFLNSYGGQWRTRALCKNLATIRERAGLPDDVKLYGTRHFYACNAILNGVDIATLAELMGHTNTTTTSRYIHLVGKDDHLAAAAAKAVKPR